MNNNQESNLFIPILSAIAGIGAIVTVLSPLSLQNDTISKLFILPDIISAVTITAIIISIIIIWYSSTSPTYLDALSVWGRVSMYQWTIIMIVIFTLFYILKIMSINNILDKYLAGIFQIVLYLSGYYVLSLILGKLLKKSYEAFNYKKMESERYDKIQETLSKAGLINTELLILGESYASDSSGNVDYSKMDVKLKIKDKLYTITFSYDYSRVFHTQTHNISQ